MTVRRMDSLDDQMRGFVTYELGNGQQFRVDERHVRELGLAAIMRDIGLDAHLSTERTAVFQAGRKIGTMAPAFDPLASKSTSFFYEPRQGDFTLTERGWEAAAQLGPGDIEAIPEFVWDDGYAQAGRAGRREEERQLLREALFTSCDSDTRPKDGDAKLGSTRE